MLVGSIVFLGSAMHSQAYFVPTNRWILALTLIALGASIPALGIALREWRKGFHVARLTPQEKMFVGSSIVAAALAAAVAAIATPRVSETAAALAANDVARARTVLEALLSTRGGESDVLAAQDNVELAEASKLSGDAKLQLLDQVAARKGSRAAESARIARATRLSSVTGSLEAGLPADALKSLDRWFSRDSSSDQEVAELRGRAEDKLFSACGEERCRFASALRANRASPNAARTTRFETSKTVLLSSLKFTPIPNEAVPDRLKRLRLLAEAAAAARDAAAGDQDVLAAAQQATDFAMAERSHVAVIGAQEAAVAELLGPLTSTAKLVSKTEDQALRMNTTKQRVKYRIHLPEAAMELLRWHVGTQLATAEMKESELLFPAITGGYRSPSVLNKPFEEVGRAIGLNKRFTQRGLRRTFNDLARAAQVEGVVTKSISGHLTEWMRER